MAELIEYFWFFIFVFSVCLSLVLTYVYLKEKDKRKLIFAISFYIASLSFIPLFFGIKGIDIEFVLFRNLYYWGSIPLMLAINISLVEKIKRYKNLNKVFIYFVFAIFLSLLPTLSTFDVTSFYSIVRQILAIDILALSLILFIKNKQLSNILFFLAMTGFTIGGFALAFGYEYLGVYSQLTGYIFITLIFIKPKIKADSKKGFSSYFSLEQKLEDTKKILQKTEEKYKKLVNNSPDLIIETKLDGTILTINDSMAKNFGKESKELVGKNINNLLPKKILEERKKATFESFEKNKIITTEDERRGRYFQNIYIPMTSDTGEKSIQIIARDINNQKKTNQLLTQKIKELKKSELATLNIMEDFQTTISELEKAKKEINDLNKNLEKKVDERTVEVKKLLKQKDEFIHQLGHDLKTPLTPITTLLPIVKEKIDDEKLEEMLDVSIKNADYIKNLVIKTLQLARLNSPTLKLDIEKTNILDEINKILEKKKYFFEKNDIDIEYNVNDNLYIDVDKIRLEELFDNIISNAIKYLPDKKGKIIIDAEEKGNETTISIRDTGVGMTEDQIDHIFDEFYKIDDSRHDLESTGLGLTICKRIVEHHGGKIWAESQGENKGTTFYVTLKNKKDFGGKNN
ncbi:PAS domain S-box protein [Candidatus Woesearchaeota archaeon]|nr:PAS domain S-box protein [Candidatus Woesearchaeota archaeon]